MGLNEYSAFRIQTLSTGGWECSLPEGPGLFRLMTNITQTGLKNTISITDGDRADASLPIQDMGDESLRDDQFSIWARHGTLWRYIVVGAADIEDIAVPLLDAIRDDDADELRICPPGCTKPGKMT